VYASEDIIEAARILVLTIREVTGEQDEKLERELRRLLERAAGGESVEGELLALFTSREDTRQWAREFLAHHGEEGVAKTVRPRAQNQPDAPPVELDAPPVGADEAEPAGTSTLRRTPHLDAPDELPTAIGTDLEISVWADSAPMTEFEKGEQVAIEIPEDVESVELGLLVTVSAHLAVEGSPYAPLVLRRAESSTERVRFKLRVVGGDEPGEAGIEAVFIYKGHTCGKVERHWAWDPANATAPALPADEEAVRSYPVHLDSTEPDLCVIITAPSRDGVHFTCSVQTSLLPEHAVPSSSEEWVLENAARVADFVAECFARMLASDDPAERKDELRAAGVVFYENSPKLFQDVLEKLIKAERKPRTILISSAEPTMPWELMIPSFKDDAGLPVDQEPLGVEYAIGRWVRGDMKSPLPRLQVRDSFIVAPAYADRPLDASQERAFLTERLNCVDAPTGAETLDAFLRDHKASILHFVCHGAAVANDDAVYLDDDKELRASIVRIKEGFKAACRERPLVFLNSCETGRLVPSLGGAGGFPKVFGDLGASAIIAPLWPVRDTVAHEVAVDLIYRRGLDEPERTLAELVRDVRARAYDTDPFEDSYAAYCYYGDPANRLERA
jgi:hypothetical protein